MIKEFALEPDVLATSFRDFSYFIEKFGVAQGRVISRFPKDWKKMVYQAAQANLRGTRELSRIEIRLKEIKDDVLLESRRPGGDGAQPWQSRALAEHASLPFSGIIALDNPTAHPDVMISVDLDGADPRFQAFGQRHINRTSNEIVDCVGLLLDRAKTVKLIDPHFNPTRARWRRMLGLVLARLKNNGQAGVTLEIHRSDDGTLPANMQSYFDSTIPNIRPAGVSVQVFLHPLAAMHNRFILTNVGGASYHTGLDDNEDGNSTPTDLVSLLSADTFSTEWATHSGHAAFRIYL
ncbi:hypothetical protein [Azonexus sp. IMCC34839]|uniref:hypothetical protein n=1 Tax=Azonexus sp. IMCC34839 TaxID=3133695 RepID=UPI00399C258B